MCCIRRWWDSALEAGEKGDGGRRRGEGEASCWKVDGVEKVRIVSGCVEQMWAWVRYAGESERGDGVEKMDVDLCDRAGAGMRGDARSELGERRGEGRGGGEASSEAVLKEEKDKAGVQAME